MKHLIALILFSSLSTDCFSQGKWKKKTTEIKTDTLDVFRTSSNKFVNEKDYYQVSKNGLRVVYLQQYDDPKLSDDEYVLDLSVIFDHLDSIKLNKDYDLSRLKAEFEEIAFTLREYNKPTGRIRLIRKTRKSLTFNCEISVLSTDRTLLLIFNGKREFEINLDR